MAMRIVLITDRYAPETRAAAYHTHCLAQGLAAAGEEVRVLTRQPTGYLVDGVAIGSGERVEQGVRVNRIRAWMAGSRVWQRALDQVWVAARMTLELLRGPKADAILVLSPPLLMTLPAIAASVLRGIPFVLNVHDLYPRVAVELGVLRSRALIAMAGWLERLAYRRASRILVSAPATQRILESEAGCAEGKTALMNNFVDLRDWSVLPRENGFRRKHGLEGRFVVLYAGLMGLAQDLEVVLRCAAANRHETNWRFVLVGDGPRAAALREQSVGLDNVLFLPMLDQEEYFEALRAADVGLASLTESFHSPAVPGKLATILACGRPAVALVPAGNDSRALLRDSGGGFALDSGDDRGLADVLRSLSRDPEMAREAGARGNAYARAYLSLENALGVCAGALRDAAGADGVEHDQIESVS